MSEVDGLVGLGYEGDTSALVLAHQLDELLILDFLLTLDFELAECGVVLGETLRDQEYLGVCQIRLLASELLEVAGTLHGIQAVHGLLKCLLLTKHALKVDSLKSARLLAD